MSLPAVRRMDVTRAQRRTPQITELVEHEQRMMAGAGEVAVAGGAFLIAMRRADCIALDGLAADDPAHRGITSQPVGVVHLLVSGKPTEHRLAQHAEQIVATVAARAPVDEVLAGDGHQAERVIEFAICK